MRTSEAHLHYRRLVLMDLWEQGRLVAPGYSDRSEGLDYLGRWAGSGCSGRWGAQDCSGHSEGSAYPAPDLVAEFWAF